MRYSENDEINNIYFELDKLGEEVNWQDGKFDAENILEHAEQIKKLLDRYLELK